MKKVSSAFLALALSLVSSNNNVALAALPPGYETDNWCPPGCCDRPVNPGEGFAGPQSAFHECYDPGTGNVVDEVWTGELTNTTVPEGWVSPEPCAEEDTCAILCVDEATGGEYIPGDSFLGSDGCNSLMGVSIGVACNLK